MKIFIGNYPKKGKRKINIRIDKWDTWSMDATLALIIVPMLKQLKKTKHGVPGHVIDKEYNDLVGSEDFHENKEKQKRAKQLLKEDLKRWKAQLDEMIWAFSQLNKDWEAKYSSGKVDHIWVPIEEKEGDEELFELKEGPKHTFKVDREGIKKHQERIQAGIDLFAKHYFSLWD